MSLSVLHGPTQRPQDGVTYRRRGVEDYWFQLYGRTTIRGGFLGGSPEGVESQITVGKTQRTFERLCSSCLRGSPETLKTIHPARSGGGTEHDSCS